MLPSAHYHSKLTFHCSQKQKQNCTSKKSPKYLWIKGFPAFLSSKQSYHGPLCTKSMLNDAKSDRLINQHQQRHSHCKNPTSTPSSQSNQQSFGNLTPKLETSMHFKIAWFTKWSFAWKLRSVNTRIWVK